MTESRIKVTRGQAMEEWGAITQQGDWDDGKVLKTGSSNVYKTL